MGLEGNKLPPSYQKDMAELWTEIRKLQRGSDRIDNRDPVQGIFSWAGALTAGAATKSPPYMSARGGGILYECMISCGTVGTTNVTVTMWKNSVNVGTAVLTAGLNNQPKALNLAYTRSDLWQVSATGGAGLTDLTISLRYS